MKTFSHLGIYHFVIYLVIGLFCGNVYAADITPQEAIDIANKFVQHDQVAQKAIRRAPAGTKVSPSIAHKMPSRVAAEKDNVYIVNLGNDQGFVVVSGETGTTAQILGYCDHGSFNYDDAPIQLKDLLDYYVEAVDTLRKNPEMADPQTQNRANVRKVVSWPSYLGSIIVDPLLKTTWNQWAPYNDKCPQADGGSSGGQLGGRCPSGCVPTAVAQVMKYWEWPKDTFDWDNMLDNYGQSYDESGNFGRLGISGTYTEYNSVQADAVATLMADIGTKMGTQYHWNGSPTGWGCQVLVDYYNYEPDWEAHSGETGENVASYIKADLDQNRPVLFCGYPKSGDGHALVCDGYTSKDYFHFNYGWGGYYNGFYLMKSLPLYTYNVSVLTNIRPYEAEQKVIDGIKYGLKHTGEAEIVEYSKGLPGLPNGSVVLPDSVTDPETGITYPVTRIRQTAFYRKGYFDKLVIGNNIEAIDAFTFFYTKMDTLVLSDKMEVIPDEAFQILKIKHVTLGANTKRIGKRAFALMTAAGGQDLTIVSKSPAFEIDEEGFKQTNFVLDDWMNCITKLGKKAFCGVRFSKWRDIQLPNLEVIGDSAFALSYSYSGTPVFRIQAKVKEISKSAFDGWQSASAVSVSPENPYFYGKNSNIYNKTQTSLVLSFNDLRYGCPETLVRLEPGCFRSNIGDATIPGTIVEMEGAFRECETLQRCTIHCVVPPEIMDETFNDKIFENYAYTTLYVPAGTEELYRQAPGWRRFTYIIGELPYEPTAAPGMTYRMVVHSDSAQATAKVAIEEVNKIRLTEENGVPTATLSINGRPDMQAPTEWIDSITWSPSFVFDSEEVFELNDSTYTIEAQKCNIAFDQTVFDGDVQVMVRNSVIVPRITDGVIDGGCVSISLLTDSGLVHELCGTAEIIFPVGRDTEHDICAAWFNSETGEWEPVYYEYNAESGTLYISTNHLSEFSWYRLARTNTRQTQLLTIANPVVGATARAVNELNDALDLLTAYISSDEPDAMATRFFRNEAGFWQSVGLDCLYNGVISVTDPAFNFKPELIDEALTDVGNIGMAFTILDISRAEYEGDKVGVAANSMKFVLNHVTGALTSNFGTAALSASMSIVAFIGVALEHFGTSMQNFKMDYFRWAYRYYYSMDGYHVMGSQSKWANSGKHSYYRTPKDWYEFFEPTFLEGVMTSDQLENYIKQSVRDYCERFWNEYPEVQNYAYDESRKHGWQSFWDSTEQLRWQISDEYYSELMNSTLVSVFRALKNNVRNNAHKRFVDEHGKMCSYVNKMVGLKFKDSSRELGEDSQFAGMKVEFTEVPKNVTDKPNWQCKLNSNGEAALGWFTIYALLENDVYTQITLYDSLDIPVKTYDFEISYSTKDKQVITIDLAKDGMFAAEYEPIPGLYLEYDPDSISMPVTWGKEGDGYSSVINEENLYLNDSIITYRRTRFRAEIERFFNTHKTITEHSNGTIMIGEDLLVVMNGNQGDATFPLKTTYRFKEQSEVEFVKIWNNPNTKFYDIEAILNGKMQHDLQCQVHVERVLVEDHYEYQLTYTGSGTCHLEVKIINYIDCEFDPNNIFDREKIDVDHIATGTCFGDADVTLHYQTTIQPEEQSEQ